MPMSPFRDQLETAVIIFDDSQKSSHNFVVEKNFDLDGVGVFFMRNFDHQR